MEMTISQLVVLSVPTATASRAGASAFMPVMQYHSEFNHHQLPLRDRTPWHVAEMTGDERVVPVFREFAHVRQRLVDYLIEQVAETVRIDRPLMRACSSTTRGGRPGMGAPAPVDARCRPLDQPVTQKDSPLGRPICRQAHGSTCGPAKATREVRWWSETYPSTRSLFIAPPTREAAHVGAIQGMEDAAAHS